MFNGNVGEPDNNSRTRNQIRETVFLLVPFQDFSFTPFSMQMESTVVPLRRLGGGGVIQKPPNDPAASLRQMCRKTHFLCLRAKSWFNPFLLSSFHVSFRTRVPLPRLHISDTIWTRVASLESLWLLRQHLSTRKKSSEPRWPP